MDKLIIIAVLFISTSVKGQGITLEGYRLFPNTIEGGGKVVSKYDTTIIYKGLAKCQHKIVAEKEPYSSVTTSCTVNHGWTGCPNDWFNKNYICTICLYHFNIKESRYVEAVPDDYAEAKKRLDEKLKARQ